MLYSIFEIRKIYTLEILTVSKFDRNIIADLRLKNFCIQPQFMGKGKVWDKQRVKDECEIANGVSKTDI